MSLSQQETDFLTTFAASGKRIFTFEQAADYFQSKNTAQNTLRRLTEKKWLQRLDRGLYLIIPLEAGPERQWSESAYIVASHLISPGAMAYWSALRFWNLTEQIPNSQFIQTTKRKRPITIQGMKYRFITVRERYFFGVQERNIEGFTISVTDREKTLLDAAARPDLSGGIAHLAQILDNHSNVFSWDRLHDYLIRWGKGVVAKRLGYLVQTMGLPIPHASEKLAGWHALISKGVSLLEPGMGDQGSINTYWQIKANVLIPKWTEKRTVIAHDSRS